MRGEEEAPGNWAEVRSGCDVQKRVSADGATTTFSVIFICIMMLYYENVYYVCYNGKICFGEHSFPNLEKDCK